MNTRKYPRTMNEAFGPYAHQCRIEDPERPMDWQDRVVIAGCIVCLIGMAAVFLYGAMV